MAWAGTYLLFSMAETRSYMHKHTALWRNGLHSGMHLIGTSPDCTHSDAQSLHGVSWLTNA